MRMVVTGLLVLSALNLSAGAQSMEEKYEKKLTKDFASKVSWIQNLEEAGKKATAENKLIFGYFSRSYSP